MPHQLRRIITVNIRNPNGGLPSGRIAELDPRGGVLAIGDNGVGKTTFLRLLPLFYGATPTQILKGTGRSLMISYTLPDASSAVCYEYERETAEDLRCVVMHARPNEEAPHFHIIHGGYREEYFYDDSNQYVSRDDFKARVESFGVEVSRKLLLHQYRSVILSEKSPTKEGLEFRRLAAVHSLGPRPLPNLDQIAAAMANEKINFRDLQNIVLDHVLDSSGPGAANAKNTHKINLSRQDVVHWIDARAHLNDILYRKPEAPKIAARIARVKVIHLELCALHLAVKAAWDHASSDLLVQKANEGKQREAFTTLAGELETAIALAKAAHGAATTDLDTKSRLVNDADARLKHFEKINAAALEIQQGNEPALLAQLVAAENDQTVLTEAAGDASTRAGKRRTAIEESFAPQMTDIDTRLLAVHKEFNDRAEELYEAEQNALGALAKPVRLGEITNSLLGIASQVGALKSFIASPTASPEANEALVEADSGLTRAGETVETAQDVLGKARVVCEEAKAANDTAVAKVTQLDMDSRKLAARQDALLAEQTPPTGSLLEFIRAGDQASWASTAKIIDPALLSRTDLQPEYVDDDLIEESAKSVVRVGPAQFTVDGLSNASWMDTSAIKAAIAQCNVQIQVIAQELQVAQAEAKRVAASFSVANAALQTAIAQESIAITALKAAKANKQRVVALVTESAAERKKGAEVDLNALFAQSSALQAEVARIEAGQESTRLALQNDFKGQRKQLGIEKEQTEKRLADEKLQVAERKQASLTAINSDLETELKGRGIDPQRLKDVGEAISRLQADLRSITENRHEVAAWVKFKREIIPTMETNKSDLQRQQVLCGELKTKWNGLLQDQETLADRVRTTMAEIAEAIADREREIERLGVLLAHGLKDFIDHVPVHMRIDRPTPELEDSIRKLQAELDTQTTDLLKEWRSLRNEMVKYAGGPADWLDGKEKTLPDKQMLLPHQYLCEQAQIVCDWFDTSESGPYIDQLNKEMFAFFNVAGEFVRVLDQFERRVSGFNDKLQGALGASAKFERFRDLSVRVSSSVGQLSYLSVLRQMQDRGNRNPLAYRSMVLSDTSLPTEEDAVLVKAFRDLLQNDGAFKVNLHDQVRLECSLIENGLRRTISNEEEFRSVSSNGNSALITAMFLIGFIQMVRGDAPVRLTWVTDEIGRFSPGNLQSFLETLDMHKIDVISASPSLDPALGRLFPRLCIFEDNGAVFTAANDMEDLADVEA